MEGFPGGSDSKESACNAGGQYLIPGFRSFPGEWDSYPLPLGWEDSPGEWDSYPLPLGWEDSPGERDSYPL